LDRVLADAAGTRDFLSRALAAFEALQARPDLERARAAQAQLSPAE
jgi:hypothetical protein